mmetsp:Transcript_13938/g.20591  ORF Transcript_13938/g.20591 Transcript_13938/m.20591 type:complete len:350 (-) Transcript_13938:57-1106(-)
MMVDLFSKIALMVLLSFTNAFSAVKQQQTYSNVLIMDHLNINHQKGRHDLLKAFYFDFLRCAIDPRKSDNIASGKKTLWANVGAQQFHLPEGKPDAQVLDGVVTLVYPNVDELVSRFGDMNSLDNTCFDLQQISDKKLHVTDPWGTKFVIVEPSDEHFVKEKDERGIQKGDPSVGLGLLDLTIYTPAGANLEGIGRFYQQVLDAPLLCNTANQCTVSMGPYQTLSFVHHPDDKTSVNHADLRDEPNYDETKPFYPSNYGPHISIYVADIKSAYRRAAQMGVTYVNPRFKRRAYTVEEVIGDCMFRCLDIVDPENGDVILQLEHEIRSVVTRDGGLYKSCPFDSIPKECI